MRRISSKFMAPRFWITGSVVLRSLSLVIRVLFLVSGRRVKFSKLAPDFFAVRKNPVD